jgi:integrase
MNFACCGHHALPKTGHFGPLIKLLILTGQRRSEVAEMRWPEIDFSRRLWTLPRERVKNDSAHEVPLSDQAIAVLEQLPRIKNKVGLVFTTNANTPVSGFTRAKDRLDVAIVRAMRDAAEEDGDDWNEVDGLAPWTLHDLRRTAATGMAHVDPTPG